MNREPKIRYPKLGLPPIVRFMDLVQYDLNGGCWLWEGTVSGQNYASFKIGRKHYTATRYIYEKMIAPIPPGHMICHRCDNTFCVNPDHLFTGTHSDNMRDMHSKGRWRRPKTWRVALTPDMVMDIRSERLPQNAFARLYGVSPATVRKAKQRKTWRHVA